MRQSITAGLVLGLGLLFGCDRSKAEPAPVVPAQGQAGQTAEVEAAKAEPEPAANEAGAEWVEAPTLVALRAAADEAGDQPIAVELSAAWCLPCKQLAEETLADGAVVERLAGTAKVTVDVSDGTDAQVDIQERLAAQTLPHLLIYRSGKELAAVLADEPEASEPAVRVQTFVTPAELLGKLDATGL